MKWNKSTTESRVHKTVKDLKPITIKRLVREIDLAKIDIPLDEAYRVDGVHSYIEIVNARNLLESDASESERSHKRFLRFLHLFQRVVHTGVLANTSVYKIDHQNQRVHLIVYKPYDDLAARVATMVTVSAALQTLLLAANKEHDEMPDARVRVGIETGECLAVRNGTRGERELLFLGHAANYAAKLLGGKSDGIYLGAAGRTALGDAFATKDDKAALLSDAQLAEIAKKSTVTLNTDALLKSWREEVKNTPLSEFQFSRPTPPLSNLNLDQLTPLDSRRIEAAAIMGDIDGFSAYIAQQMSDDKKAGEAVRALHVIRKELRDVLNDFGGIKVRYIGDCIQGVLAEGAKDTNYALTTENALWCAAAMRDAFAVCLSHFPSAKSLGLAIGVELGLLSLTRLGVKGSRDRCVAGKAMLVAEDRQKSINGRQSAIGGEMFKKAEGRVKLFLERGQVIDDLTTNKLDAALRAEESKTSQTVTSPNGSPITLPKAYRQ
jgi:class 3 adenylate cyclase